MRGYIPFSTLAWAFFAMKMLKIPPRLKRYWALHQDLTRPVSRLFSGRKTAANHRRQHFFHPTWSNILDFRSDDRVGSKKKDWRSFLATGPLEKREIALDWSCTMRFFYLIGDCNRTNRVWPSWAENVLTVISCKNDSKMAARRSPRCGTNDGMQNKMNTVMPPVVHTFNLL